jgi:hypothetical protein
LIIPEKGLLTAEKNTKIRGQNKNLIKNKKQNKKKRKKPKKQIEPSYGIFPQLANAFIYFFDFNHHRLKRQWRRRT